MIKRILFLVSLAVGITLILRTFLIDTISVASASMEPTLGVGTHYLVNRLVYRFSRPRHGDIIVFLSPVDHKKGSIKRVIALEGDTIELREKKVVLNHKPLEEPYVVYKRPEELLDGDNLGPLKVPEGHVFVLGDNRDESLDSTTWKDSQTGERIFFLALSKIKGRVIQIP